ncbi:MAG: M28 family peptidase [Blastocatellia bacterium]|nr:M28 family peptidase [Blastocatellia bacterium]
MKKIHLSRRGLALVMLAALSVVSVASAGNMPLPSSEATASITVRDLKKHLSFLASDELGGRYTLSSSSAVAARYLASQLEYYGYKGAARDGSFFQKVPIGTRTVHTDQTGITLNTGADKKEFKYAEDFASQSPVGANVSGGLVFVGYGISSPANKHDDYSGLDVKGKVVVLLLGVPESLQDVKLEEHEQGEKAAIAHGAAGMIIIAPRFLHQWEQIKRFIGRERAGLPPPSSTAGKDFPTFMAGPPLVKALAEAMGKAEAYLAESSGNLLKPATIPGTVELKMSVSAKDTPVAQNVVGILEGADPALKDQYVVFSAHYDHLETRNGQVFNGADDDGSGTVAVLEIAEALATGPRSKRSVLIIFHTGEEMGLLGSQFNTDYEPVVPLEKLVANFNIDMIGRSRPEGDTKPSNREMTDKDSVYVIGADKLSTELHQINEQTNKDTVRLRFDYTYNDENHPARFYYRSDHYHYAKHGIPIIFYFTGVHEDYHRPTDDVEKIDFEKIERITRMVFATGWRVANLDHRLVVDKKPAVRQ